MKKILFLLSILWLAVGGSVHATTILAQGCRNVKVPGGTGGFVNYGGTAAAGDYNPSTNTGTDDTQAFLDAFNLNRSMSATTDSTTNVAVYVPPGNYLVSQQLIPWGPCIFFGDPANPPTIYLKGSTITSGSIPADGNGTNLPLSFICVRWGTFQAAYSTKWNCNTGVNPPSSPPNPVPGRSNNNCFDDFIHDINFTVLSGNTGVKAVLEWSCAQATALRNVVLTGTSSQSYALWTRPGANGDAYGSGLNNGEAGGGGIIQNVTCNGVATATMQDSVFERTIRGCTFNGTFIAQGGCNTMSIIGCTFNDSGSSGSHGLVMNSNPLLTLDDCTFASGTQFSNGGGAAAHLENCSFASANTSPAFSAGTVAQYTSNSVLYNQSSESGTSSNLNGSNVVRGTTFYNPPYPGPNSGAVNITAFGGSGNNSTDNSTPLANAFASGATDVYFPPGTYLFNSTINLTAGQRLFGQSEDLTRIVGSSNPIVSVAGRYTGAVGMVSISVRRTGGSGPNITWNGDQSSVLMDVGLGGTINYAGPFIDFASGGCFYEGGSVNTGNAQSVTKYFSVESTDPLYMVAIDPQHSGGTPIVMTNAQNVVIREMTYEMLVSNAMTDAMTISGCNKLNFGGVCFADRNSNNATAYGFDITSSNVSIWPFSMNACRTAMLKDGSFTTGSNGAGSFVNVGGYITPSIVIPSAPGTLSTVGFSTPNVPSTLTLVP